jgi:hypothetical protein
LALIVVILRSFGGLGFKVEDESSTLFLRIYGFDLFLGGERKEILFVVSWHEMNGI